MYGIFDMGLMTGAGSLDLLLLLLLLLLLPLQLQLLRLLLVILPHEDERMQGEDTSYHGAYIDCEHHIVVLGREGTDQFLAVQIGKQVDDLLQQEDDLVVGWQFSLLHVAQVDHDLLDFTTQTTQGLHLLGDTALQGV
jgi:hypothetical protein